MFMHISMHVRCGDGLRQRRFVKFWHMGYHTYGITLCRAEAVVSVCGAFLGSMIDPTSPDQRQSHTTVVARLT